VGDGTSEASLAPKRIGSASDWTTVSLSHSHACGLRAGALHCWGINHDGELGLGDRSARLAPQRVGSASDWTAVSAGGAYLAGGSGGSLERYASHTCGLRGVGQLHCWGANAWGELGDGTTTDRLQPTRIGVEDDWVAVSAGGGITRGIRSIG
jgi:alpha-tubulin suppressor-like RCC1 family protein